MVSTVVELRQYTHVPGGRDVLTELFDREFVETQEAVGTQVIGQFHDEADPSRYVWLRGFRDMDARKAALSGFYLESDTWREHGAAARATMIDSGDVLLLRPAIPGSGFPQVDGRRPPVGAPRPESRVMATMLYRRAPVDDAFTDFFGKEIAPVVAELGGASIAAFEVEPSENNFPQLPVRTGENVFVWFSVFETAEHQRMFLDRLARSAKWTERILPALDRESVSPLERLSLVPTGRSMLR